MAEKNRPDGYTNTPIRIKNAYWSLEIDRITGELTVFGSDGKKYIEHAGIIGLEERRGDYITSMELSGRKFPAAINFISPVHVSPVSSEIELSGTVYGLGFSQKIKLPSDSPQIQISNKIQWKTGNYVRLEQTFPFSGEHDGEICYGVPFGMVKYPETIYKNGLDFGTIVTPERGNDPDSQVRKIRLASLFVSANDLTITSDHRMWEFEDHEIRNCMVRGIGWCSGAYEVLVDGSRKSVQRPPDGEYVCNYVITPGTNPKAGWEAAAPLYPVGIGYSNPDADELKLLQLPATDGTSVIGGNVKLSEDGTGVIVRLFESTGNSAEILLPDGKWYETDMLERNPVSAEKILRFNPFEIKTLFRSFL